MAKKKIFCTMGSMNQQEVARERAAKGLCIICGSGEARVTRGLCVKHHTRYLKQRNEIKAHGGDADAFDDLLISSGLLLPRKQGRRVDPDEDIFAQAAAQFLAGTGTGQGEGLRPELSVGEDPAGDELDAHIATREKHTDKDAERLAAEAMGEIVKPAKPRKKSAKGGAGRKKKTVGKKGGR